MDSITNQVKKLTLELETKNMELEATLENQTRDFTKALETLLTKIKRPELIDMDLSRNPSNSFARKITTEHGVTQSKLAILLGATQAQVSLWSLGKRAVPTKYQNAVQMISEYLDAGGDVNDDQIKFVSTGKLNNKRLHQFLLAS